MGTIAPPHPFARGGYPIGCANPTTRPHEHALIGHPHFQQNTLGRQAARLGFGPARGVILR